MEYQEIEEKMQKAIDYLCEELAGIRAGRANPAILNKVTVEYYGVQTPLNQIGAISVPEARQILITPWDRSLLGAITKAIQVAELGVNPINDGNGVRLTFPELNEERRKGKVADFSAGYILTGMTDEEIDESFSQYNSSILPEKPIL